MGNIVSSAFDLIQGEHGTLSADGIMELTMNNTTLYAASDDGGPLHSWSAVLPGTVQETDPVGLWRDVQAVFPVLVPGPQVALPSWLAMDKTWLSIGGGRRPLAVVLGPKGKAVERSRLQLGQLVQDLDKDSLTLLDWLLLPVLQRLVQARARTDAARPVLPLTGDGVGARATTWHRRRGTVAASHGTLAQHVAQPLQPSHVHHQPAGLSLVLAPWVRARLLTRQTRADAIEEREHGWPEQIRNQMFMERGSK